MARPVDRRRFRHQLIVGALLTLGVAAGDWFGLLDVLEHKLYDLRCRHCQAFLRPPAPPVHVDIDSKAIEVIGRWPWPRARMAEILDELRLAGAKTITFDVTFAKADEKDPDGDAAFAGSVGRTKGSTVIAVILATGKAVGIDARLAAGLRAALSKDLELSPEDAHEVLRGAGIGFKKDDADFTSLFVDVRRDAMLGRILAELDAGRADRLDVRNRLLPGASAGGGIEASPLGKLFADQFDRALRVREMRRFTRPADPALPAALPGLNRDPLVLPLATAAGGAGFANYDSDSDGVVRAVPLWIDVEGRMFPQLGLATVCAAVGTRPADVRVTPTAVVVPRHDGGGPDIVIPTHARDLGNNRGVAHCMNVPMFGRRDWETMYDFPRHARAADHISAVGVYRIASTRRQIAENQAIAARARNDIDRLVVGILEITDPDVADNYKSLSPDQWPRAAMLAQAVAAIPGKLEELTALPNPPKALSDQIKRLKAAPDKLKAAQAAIDAFPAIDRPLQAQLAQQKQDLADRVRGRVVFIGWIADGQVDFVPTPVHQRCPGVVVHGAIYNAALSGELWTTAPKGYTLALTVFLGFLSTIVVSRLAPTKGLLAALALAGLYAAANGFLLFDYGDLIVGAAAPLTVVGMVWGGATLTRVIDEIGQRARITRRFRSYIDPRLVQYVIDHPELMRLEGEVREMTVAFTDLAGFTTLTEQLGARTVKVLGRYMSRMVPVIRRNRGFVHRFMGDGIMFSYGAPEPNPDHAADAVATVLQMQVALAEFNKEIVAEGFPALKMRAGVSTGNVVVGDSGADDACDYTCLGDVTNLGARLEASNKAVGTLMLLSARTVELLGGRYLVRPVGELVVPGKATGVKAYEPIALAADATDAQRRLAELTTAMVDHYVAARFAEAVAAADELEEVAGPSKLTTVYRHLSRKYLADPPAEFRGQIIVQEK